MKINEIAIYNRKYRPPTFPFLNFKLYSTFESKGQIKNESKSKSQNSFIEWFISNTRLRSSLSSAHYHYQPIAVHYIVCVYI